MLSARPRRSRVPYRSGCGGGSRYGGHGSTATGGRERTGCPRDESRRAESIRSRAGAGAGSPRAGRFGPPSAATPGSTRPSIALEAGPGGKPRLSADPSTVRFNLSHSGGPGAGRDHRRARGRDRRRAHRPKRPAAFYRSWVRREARAKCAGAGILAPPPEEPIWVTDLDLGPGWAAALALRGPSAPMPLRARARRLLGPGSAAGEVDEGVPGGLRPQALAVVEEADRVAEVADVGEVLPGEPVGPLEVEPAGGFRSGIRRRRAAPSTWPWTPCSKVTVLGSFCEPQPISVT